MKNKSLIGIIPHLDDGGYYFVEPLESSNKTKSGIILAAIKHQSIHLRDLHQKTANIIAYRDNPLQLNIGDKIVPKHPATKPFKAPKEFYVKKVDNNSWELATETEWLLEKEVVNEDRTFIKENVKKVWPIHHSEIMCVCEKK